MNENTKNKIELSNKIYPYFAGLTDDLMFWAAINTLFLTTVKNFSASQVSMLSAISIFSTIIFQGIVFKIIKRLGNLKSVRTGVVLLLLAAIIMTFAKSFFIVGIGKIIYDLSFYFIGMGSVILKRNLKAVNKEEDFSKIQSKASFNYAVITMIISFIAGFVFNINKYLPMILSISICTFNIFLSSYIYEYKSDDILESKQSKKTKVNWNIIIILIIVVYGLLYGTVETLQENGKIFIQYDLQEYIDIGKASIGLTVIIAFSRISRVMANAVFDKMYKKLKQNLIILINFLVVISASLMISGSLINYNVIGTLVMAIGFCILLFARDPIMIFTKVELFNNCEVKDQEIVMHRYNLSRKIVRCFLATAVSLLLTKVKMIYIITLLLIFLLFYFGITIDLAKKLKK